ncbi:tyrosine-type recombinase/integrase [Pararhizobium sp. LjRoot238]|uniref:tyrosine-type recombinase/integrase n=1 Tax=Pararhizobium sp. LjRoot238 TaxID=3342293 RepID=UPI003ECF2D8B
MILSEITPDAMLKVGRKVGRKWDVARSTSKLTARTVETIKEIGKHSDGGGLYLKVAPDGKRWVFMYTWLGKRVELGLGRAADMPLKSARDVAQRYRTMVSKNEDPRIERAEEKKKLSTFGEVALEFIETQEGSWRNSKHRDQWYFTLSLRKDEQGKFKKEGYCVKIRDLPVDSICTEHVVSVLKPIWQSKPETASRLRGRIESVLNAAKVMKLRTGENPAAWRGHLSNILPKKQKLSRGHHSAMPFADVPAFTQAILKVPTVSNLALAFAILTAARSGEAMGAVWAEIDLESRVWRVPAERMKGGREHVVPLSDGAVTIVETMIALRRPDNEHIFPGKRGPLSVMALTMAMRRHGAGEFTAHGFRSSFRDWAGDATTFKRDDIELCLAHAISDKTEAAYRRGHALEKRRKIMKAWADFLTGLMGENVIGFPVASAN